jgi:aconitase A
VHHLPPRQPRDAAGQHGDRLPFSLKILLENLLRNEDDAFVKRADVEGG